MGDILNDAACGVSTVMFIWKPFHWKYLLQLKTEVLEAHAMDHSLQVQLKDYSVEEFKMRIVNKPSDNLFYLPSSEK